MAGNYRSGRKALPRELKLLRGTLRADREPRESPIPVGNVSPPRWLRGAALREWRRLAPTLVELRILRPTDRAAFIALCVAVGEFEETVRETSSSASLFDSGKVRRAPDLPRLLKLAETIRSLGGEFGLTPASRGRLALPGDEEKESDFERLRRQAREIRERGRTSNAT
jgi:P27 family predicted phage terminase small subunit